MNEVKTPKKPVINFWIGALMVLLCINIFLKPYIQKMQIQDVKYSTFISQTEKKQVKEVEVQENKIVFTGCRNPAPSSPGRLTKPCLRWQASC